MKLEPPAAAPQPAIPRSDLPGIPAATVAELTGTWTGASPGNSVSAGLRSPSRSS